MKNVISTNQAVFMVKFLNSNECFIFDSGAEILGDLIQKRGNAGVEYIKQLEGGTFKRLTKKQVNSWFKYDTHSIEKLKRVNYIK